MDEDPMADPESGGLISGAADSSASSSRALPALASDLEDFIMKAGLQDLGPKLAAAGVTSLKESHDVPDDQLYDMGFKRIHVRRLRSASEVLCGCQCARV